MTGTILNFVISSTSHNIRVLTHLHGSEIDDAVGIIENDLDTNILTLNSLRQSIDMLTVEDKIKI